MVWPFRRRAEPAPRIHVIEPKPQSVNVKRATGGAFRAGMWIVLGERVGILKELNEFSVATVTLVDEHGFNQLEIPVPVAELRQAKRLEIPALRVAHLAPEQLNRMGYGE